MTASSAATTILQGQTLAFKADPFVVGPDAAVAFESDGAVAIANGKIVEVGPASQIIARHPGAVVERYAGDLIMAGFVDCHVHYPQIDIIASYGEQLLEWLEKYTFPAEARFIDPAHAQASVSTIAFDLGFGSLGPFNRAFKDATGQTPTEWRKQPSPNS